MFYEELENLKELVKAVSEAKVDFEYKAGDDVKICIYAKQENPAVVPQVIPAMPMAAPQMPVVAPVMDAASVDFTPMTSTQQVAPAVEENCQVVSSPLVGTFYSAASPDDEPFVKVGDRVKKGQKLGIIEAMKLMNDIESDYDGEIVEILVSNESMVEYGQPLFKIK